MMSLDSGRRSKLEIIGKYLPVYTSILSKQNARFTRIYIDAFAGTGRHIAKKSGDVVAGSPSLALSALPPFHEFHFIDIEGAKIESLQRLAATRKDVEIHHGDCNQILMEKVFPRCRYENFARAVCLLDPYGLQLDWKVIETAGKLRTTEIFLNFPIMDINRNALARDARKDRPKHEDLTRFWGDESWKNAAYEPQPLPMRNSTRAIVYYLFFASPNTTDSKIVSEIFERYR